MFTVSRYQKLWRSQEDFISGSRRFPCLYIGGTETEKSLMILLTKNKELFIDTQFALYYLLRISPKYERMAVASLLYTDYCKKNGKSTPNTRTWNNLRQLMIAAWKIQLDESGVIRLPRKKRNRRKKHQNLSQWMTISWTLLYWIHTAWYFHEEIRLHRNPIVERFHRTGRVNDGKIKPAKKLVPLGWQPISQKKRGQTYLNKNLVQFKQWNRFAQATPFPLPED